MLQQLEEFNLGVEEHGISRKDIEMLELELGENVFTSRININHFTEHRTMIGVEAYRSVFKDILNRSYCGQPKLDLYKNNAQALRDLASAFERVGVIAKSIKEPCDVVLAYVNNSNNGMYFGASPDVLLNLLEQPYVDAIQSPFFLKYFSILAEQLPADHKDSIVRETTNITNAISNGHTLSTFPIVDFMLTEPIVSVKIDNDGEVFTDVITKAYEQTLLNTKVYSLRDIITIHTKMPQIAQYAEKLATYARLIKPTEVILSHSFFSIVNTIVNDWLDGRTGIFLLNLVKFLSTGTETN